MHLPLTDEELARMRERASREPDGLLTATLDELEALRADLALMNSAADKLLAEVKHLEKGD